MSVSSSPSPLIVPSPGLSSPKLLPTTSVSQSSSPLLRPASLPSHSPAQRFGWRPGGLLGEEEEGAKWKRRDEMVRRGSEESRRNMEAGVSSAESTPQRAR